MEPAGAQSVEAVFHACLGTGGATTLDVEAIDVSGLPLLVVDKETLAILAASSGAVEFYGRPRAELLRLTLADLSSRSKSPAARHKTFTRPPAGLAHLRLPRHVTRSGSAYDIDTVGLDAVYRGRPARLVLIAGAEPAARGLAARKRFSQRFEQLVGKMREGLWVISGGSGDVRYLNPAFERIMGVPRATFLGDSRKLYACVAGADREAARQFWAETLRGGEARTEFRILRPDGDSRWIRTRSFQIDDGSGETLFCGIFDDVTEHREVEQALRESEARYRRIVETAEEGILIVDAGDRIGYMNPKMAAMLGYRVEEIVGQSAFVVMDEEARKEVEPRLESRRQGVREQYEFRFRRKDGTAQWGRISASPVLDEAGRYAGALAMVTDITAHKERERCRLEEEAAQRDALVREVHHRIKNSLQGVTGMLRQFAAGHPELASILAVAAGQVQSIAQVHGLQGLTPTGGVTVCNLVERIAANVETLQHTRIEVVFLPACDPCLVVAENEAVPLALVLNELMVNAVKHAIPGTPVRVEADLDLEDVRAEIRISNAAALPAGFGPGRRFNQKGSGLQLAASLLPRRGARLVHREAGGEVTACLALESPAISLSRSGWNETRQTAVAGVDSSFSP